MSENNNHEPPTLGRLTRRTAATLMGAIENRAELFAVEAEEEASRTMYLVISGIAALFCGMLMVLLLTATVILIVPEEQRLWAAGGFTALYLAGAVGAGLWLRSLLKRVPFGESLRQIKKDAEILDAFK